MNRLLKKIYCVDILGIILDLFGLKLPMILMKDSICGNEQLCLIYREIYNLNLKEKKHDTQKHI